MRNKIFKMMIATLLIMTLASANFILLGLTTITYAAEQFTLKSETSHKNISFMAYFKEGEDKTSQYKAKADAEDTTLYMQISVKQEGYFNGKISLQDSNFKFKTDSKHERINSITEDTIVLNQITAGETIEIPVGITLLKDTKIDVSLLAMESKIKLEGNYTYGSKPDSKTVTGTRTVELTMASPYDEENNAIFLNQTILTNKVFEYKGTTSRIIQIAIDSGMEGNLFPIKTEKIELQAPQVASKYPTEVIVQTPEALAINGEKIKSSDYTYDAETGLLTIKVENVEKDGQIVWNQAGSDKYIVTYIFPTETQIEKQTLKANSEIALYDARKTTATYRRETTLSSEEIDSSISVSLNNTENEIYKGKIYEGIEREFAQKIDVQVNFAMSVDKIKVEEDTSNSNISNLETKTVSIDEQNLTDILGEEGNITIYNKATNTAIAKLEKGTTEIDLPIGTEDIVIETSKPNKEGKLTINTIKSIPAQNKNAMQNISSMNFKVTANYAMGETYILASEASSSIALKETETSAKLEISKTEFSTMKTNENVEMKITLNSNEEKYELYKNAHVKLTLPAEFEGIEITSINLLNEEEMVIKDTKTEGNTIDIQLEGEQTNYKGKAIEGAIILITANLTTNKKQKNVDTQFVLEYENQKAINYAEGADRGTTAVNAKIVSYAGVITTNAISEYGLETINNEGNKTAKLQLATESKQATVTAQVINNYDTTISGVSILGTFPTDGSLQENNIKAEVSEIKATGIDANKVKIYYSNNANATHDITDTINEWQETISNQSVVKKYMIVIDSLEPSEEIDFAYSMLIESDLVYNKVAAENYIVYFTIDSQAEQTMQSETLKLETGVGPEITSTLNASIGNKSAETAKEGEKIQYTITIENTGSEPVQNVEATGKVPEGTVYVEEIPLSTEMGGEEQTERFKEDADRKQVTFNEITLQPGEKTTRTYMVKVQKGTQSKITNTVETKYGEAKKVSNKIETDVKQGEVEVTTVKGVFTFDEMESGRIGKYQVTVKNISNKDLKNVKITANIENGTLQEILYLENGDIKTITDTNTISIAEIKKDETVTIELNVKISQFTEAGQKEVKIVPVATVDKEEYQSNCQIIKVTPLLVQISNSSQNENQYVKPGENITYKIDVTNVGTTNIDGLTIRDKISAQEEISNIKIDGKDLTDEQYETKASIEDGGTYVEMNENIEVGQTKSYFVTTQVDPVLDNSQAIEIDNTADIYAEGTQLAIAMVSHIIEPTSLKAEGDIDLDNEPSEVDPSGPENIDPSEEETTETPSTPTNPSKPNNPSTSNGNNEEKTPKEEVTKLISGYVWLDKNENGQRDSDEEAMDGITAKLFNTKTNEFQKNSKGEEIKATTNSKGMYTLSGVPQGNYIVVFEYDNSKYALTTYEKSGVASEKNSKVISKEMQVEGQLKTVAVTENLVIADEHISYINMGLKERKIYDMKLEKMITRVVVQNSNGTEATQFNDATLAKIDINAKQLNNTNVVVEYKIRVTNEGETEGYIKSIADYVSADYKFSSELNKDWYQTGSTVYNNSLANTKLAPGESKEVTLTLTKQMTENNTGLITNLAEIAESYNEQGLKDMDSTEANRTKGEDDMAQADLIISIKTGEIIATITVIISIIAVLTIGAIIITKKGMKKAGI